MRTHEYYGDGFCVVPIDGVPCLKDRGDLWHVQTRDGWNGSIGTYVLETREPGDDTFYPMGTFREGLLACDRRDVELAANPDQEWRVVKIVDGGPNQ